MSLKSFRAVAYKVRTISTKRMQDPGISHYLTGIYKNVVVDRDFITFQHSFARAFLKQELAIP